MVGWFSAFRKNGEGTMYSYRNRTSVSVDIYLTSIIVLFCALFTIFLIILPGVRRDKCSTFVAVTLGLFVGAVIQVAQYGSSWQTNSLTLKSSFTNQKMPVEIKCYVGLMHINVTYASVPGYGQKCDIEFNERFWWRSSTEMAECFKDSLLRGAPFAVMSVAEHFTFHPDSLYWGAKYREAGYYTCIMLWVSFISWVTMFVLMFAVPRYGVYGMVGTGLSLLGTNFMYWALLPSDKTVAYVEGHLLKFNFGWNYWIVLIAGVTCLVTGAVITLMELGFTYKFSTILQLDYDTPYDRYALVEKVNDINTIHSRMEEAFNVEPPLRPSNVPNGDQQGMINRAYIITEDETSRDSGSTNHRHVSIPRPVNYN